MAHDDRRRVAWPRPLDEPRRSSLVGLPFVAAGLVYVAYLLTHPLPSYGAGLFLETAEQIVANGYALPTSIPGYAGGSVPFGYPPLAFYVVAVLIDVVGVDPLAVARFLPGLLVVATLVPFYAFATDLAESEVEATLAAVVFATAPPVLQWHLSAGGIVRGMAFLFALCSVAAGLRAFRTHDPRWIGAGTVTFALVVLTHPTYTVFVVVSYLAVYAAVDRSLRGLAAGAVVGVGGVLLASPWWLHVAGVHGVEVFAAAAGSHGGVGSKLGLLWYQLTAPLTDPGVETPFYVAVYLGAAYALWKRRWFLPAWLLVALFAVPKTRFIFVPGAVLAASFVLEGVVPALRDRATSSHVRTATPWVVAGGVVLAAVALGTLYGAGAVPGIRDGPAQPQFVDADDVEAMAWTERNTPPDATFVVLGDAAEWHPYLSGRTILIGPWGAEWKPSTSYYAEYERQEAISQCRDADCIATHLDSADVQPDYVYVPKRTYTVFNRQYTQSPTMTASLERSDRFEVAYENDGAVVARVVPAAGTD